MTRRAQGRAGCRRAIVLAACGLVLGSCGRAFAWPWNTDMYDQPAVQPQTEVRMPAKGVVPVPGREKPMTREEASKTLKNPVVPDASSLRKGKALFDTYCVPCHGLTAKGDGPVSRKFPGVPDLHAEIFQKRTDGWIYGTIRNGGPLMPAYGEALTATDRWNVVNYLRRLQGEK